MLPSISSSILFLSLLWTSQAHMELSNPLPMRSQFDPSVPERLMDYNLKSPLTANGSNYPCHGYQNDRPIIPKATYIAGKTYSMSIAGSASHGGGSCQVSLSYDNGGTFKVIKSMIGGCPLTLNYDFTVPSFAPSGNALFAWTWFNHIGNREMYMNCAWVTIAGSSSARRKAKRQGTFSNMAALPNIWRANIAGLSTCGTAEGTDPKFSNLGPDVVYAAGLSASSPASSGTCDAATPQGQTYKASSDTGNVGGTNPSVSVPGVPSVTIPAAPGISSASVAASSAVSSAAPQISSRLIGGGGEFAEGSGESSSTSSSGSSVAAEAPTPSLNPSPAEQASSSVPSQVESSAQATASSAPPAAAAESSSTVSINSMTSLTTATTTTMMTTPPMAGEASEAMASPARTTATGVPVVGAEGAAPGTSVPAASSASFAADADIRSYLPCVAGSFLCLSATEYLICDQSIVGIPFTPVMQYIGPRPVAGGMQCSPYLAPLPDSDAAARMSSSATAASVPNGFYRSDRYVVA